MELMQNTSVSGQRCTAMLKISAAEFQRNIGRYQDLALREPVAVTRNRRDGTVLISTDEYRRLKRRDREVLGLDHFTEADVAALKASRAPDEAKEFDHERP
jgi:PHD/YefM family antitoxin component YafN of YafNO toxin-antitoxin module